MWITGAAYRWYWRVSRGWLKRRILKTPGPANLGQDEWARSLLSPTGFYLDCFRHFHQHLPADVREHRLYFDQEARSFGEDAMHVMWHWLFHELKPASFLEIGVYRGQIVSLAAMLAQRSGIACEVHGISPFSPAGDAVSVYLRDVNYLEDTLKHFEHFSLARPELLKAFSTDAAAVALIRSRAWDMIYVDGNHDYEVVKKDWAVCSESVKPGGVIVLDDAGLTTPYRPPKFATGGHPGPSRLAQEIAGGKFREILQVGHNRVFQRTTGDK
jgi:hypothetical protein